MQGGLQATPGHLCTGFTRSTTGGNVLGIQAVAKCCEEPINYEGESVVPLICHPLARYPRAGWSTWGDEAEASITPQGKQHSGYSGGSITDPLSLLYAEENTAPSLESQLAALIFEEHKKGHALPEIATKMGCSLEHVEKLLLRAAEGRGAGSRVAFPLRLKKLAAQLLQ